MTDTRQHPFGTEPPEPETCGWVYELDDIEGENIWSTDCEYAYIFSDEVRHPREAQFTFCPACGAVIEAEARTPLPPERKLHVVK